MAAHRLFVALVLIGVSSCCKQKESTTDSTPEAPVTASTAATSTATNTAATSTAPIATAVPTSTGRTGGSYPLNDIKPIPETCSSPWTVLHVITPAARKRFPNWLWPSTVQSLYAHPEFQVVGSAPTRSMQVQVLEGKHGDENFALWMRCFDAHTCNQVAAMYRAVTPTARPWVYCGAGDQRLNRASSRSLFANADRFTQEARSKLTSDLQSKCYRIGACYAREGAAPGEDMGSRCNMKPSTFRLECAQRATCSQVVECLQNK